MYPKQSNTQEQYDHMKGNMPIGMAKIQILVRMWGNRNPRLFLVGMKNGTASLEDSLAVNYKVNTSLPYDPAVILLGIYPKEVRTCLHKSLHTNI